MDSSIWIGVGILVIGFGAFGMAAAGTIFMTAARNFKQNRAPPAFRVSEEEVQIADEGEQDDNTH